MSHASVRQRKSPQNWKGFVTSLGVHGILLGLACWIVLVSPIAVKPHQDPDLFVTASGSSRPASNTQAYAIKNPPRKFQGVTRISVNNNIASIALPELSGVSDIMSASFSMEKGMGREGLGQGQGISFGSGLGDSRTLVGKFVMGATIKAQRVAVYLDCSGSMRPYLEKVTAEIKKEYPDADVFRFDGARVVSLENNIVYGKTFHGEAPRLTEAPTQTIESELTDDGRQLLSRIRTSCEKGSLGAWIDRLLGEDYDALVVFSDFQDGVRIYEENNKGTPTLIYSDSNYHKVGSLMPVKSWQAKWMEAFKKGATGQGPKLYLFSIQQPPQGLLKACVEASGGNSLSVSWLKSGRPPN
ncbi:MAG: hypothetical protein WCP90_01065 [Opitutae bacterium]